MPSIMMICGHLDQSHCHLEQLAITLTHENIFGQRITEYVPLVNLIPAMHSAHVTHFNKL